MLVVVDMELMEDVGGCRRGRTGGVREGEIRFWE